MAHHHTNASHTSGLPGCHGPTKEVLEPCLEGAGKVEAEDGADSTTGVGQDGAVCMPRKPLVWQTGPPWPPHNLAQSRVPTLGQRLPAL